MPTVLFMPVPQCTQHEYRGTTTQHTCVEDEMLASLGSRFVPKL